MPLCVIRVVEGGYTLFGTEEIRLPDRAFTAPEPIDGPIHAVFSWASVGFSDKFWNRSDPKFGFCQLQLHADAFG